MTLRERMYLILFACVMAALILWALSLPPEREPPRDPTFPCDTLAPDTIGGKSRQYSPPGEWDPPQPRDTTRESAHLRRQVEV